MSDECIQHSSSSVKVVGRFTSARRDRSSGDSLTKIVSTNCGSLHLTCNNKADVYKRQTLCLLYYDLVISLFI